MTETEREAFGPKTKKCNKCGEVKALGDFYKQRGGCLGRLSICKDCQDAKNAERKRLSGARPKRFGLRPELKDLVYKQVIQEDLNGCSGCAYSTACGKRALAGLPVLCEAIDRADVIRAQERGIKLTYAVPRKLRKDKGQNE